MASWPHEVFFRVSTVYGSDKISCLHAAAAPSPYALCFCTCELFFTTLRCSCCRKLHLVSGERGVAAAQPCQGTSVGTGRARLLGFRVGFGGQNPSLGTLRLSGFGPFRALGFSGLFQAFLVPVKHEVSLFISS